LHDLNYNKTKFYNGFLYRKFKKKMDDLTIELLSLDKLEAKHLEEEFEKYKEIYLKKE